MHLTAMVYCMQGPYGVSEQQKTLQPVVHAVQPYASTVVSPKLMPTAVVVTCSCAMHGLTVSITYLEDSCVEGDDDCDDLQI